MQAEFQVQDADAECRCSVSWLLNPSTPFPWHINKVQVLEVSSVKAPILYPSVGKELGNFYSTNPSQKLRSLVRALLPETLLCYLVSSSTKSSKSLIKIIVNNFKIYFYFYISRINFNL
jgi:hypothetical protein